jgi:hypothetical protein
VSDRKLLVLATISDVVVAAATYAFLGWNSAGAHSAARNTARLALFIFLLGFAQPGLSRLIVWLPTAAALIEAFVCAQAVHFATVVIMVLLDKTHFLRHFSVPGILIVVIGASAVLVAGFTARRTESRTVRVLHQFLLYVIFLIFFADYLEHPEKSLRVIALVLAIGLVARIAGQLYRPKLRGKVAVSANS